MKEDVKRIIETGYDAMADRFADWQQEVRGSTRLERARELLELLPGRPDVLELGVGAGVRSTRMFAERGRLTGVDISAEQLRRAHERIPTASLLQSDFTELRLDDESFDAVVAFYVLNHVPRAELGPLIARVAGWLRRGGHFLATFSTSDNPGWRGEWLGVEMYAGFPPDINRRLVDAAGFDVLRDEVEIAIEPGYGEARFQWILARRPE